MIGVNYGSLLLKYGNKYLGFASIIKQYFNLKTKYEDVLVAY